MGTENLRTTSVSLVTGDLQDYYDRVEAQFLGTYQTLRIGLRNKQQRSQHHLTVLAVNLIAYRKQKIILLYA
eukprot:SAG11_NODE_1426_length_4943_cov_7.372419_3_plen_72_part_00